jgi:hypothetical protein
VAPFFHKHTSGFQFLACQNLFDLIDRFRRSIRTPGLPRQLGRLLELIFDNAEG